MNPTVTLTRSITVRGLLVAILGFALAKIAPAIPIEQAREIADAVASIVFAIGVGLGGFGYARRAAMPAPVDGELAFLARGQNGWQTFMHEIARIAALAAIEAMERRVRSAPPDHGAG